MSGKKITFGSRPKKTVSPENVDAWVDNRVQEEKKSEKMKRLTIDIPESLHKTIKSDCALRGRNIADEVRELLFSKYGKS